MKPELIKSIRQDCVQSLSDYEESLSVLKNQSILVTGGTGFVGKWLAEAISLLNEVYSYNIKLYLLARNVCEYKEEVPHLAKQSFIHLLEQDVRYVNSLPEEISWIIHAAGTPDNRKHISKPLKTADVIYRGTQAILDACFRLPNLNKFVHLSSNYVYGQTDAQVNEHQYSKLDPNSLNATYSEAKRISETICAIYRSQQKLPITIVRPFSFIGPYQGLEKPWAINNFIRDSILGGPIRILGDENTIRSYLYGSDLAFWLLMVLANSKTGAVYNIGGSQPISLKDLAQCIIANFPNKINVLVRTSKAPSLSPSVSVPDLTAIKSDIKVKQAFDFDLALKKTINWYINTSTQG